jgi:hypothetical protein
MLRTVFMIGLFALVGLFLLNVVFGILVPLLGGLISLAIKILVIGAVLYVLIRIFSPDTARRLREMWSGSSM